MTSAMLATVGVVVEPAGLVLPHESAYVTETATGLTFHPDTPLEVVGPLIERLTRQHKRIEWAIGDAINFGETNYPGMYEQWVEQTGLAENTLSTMRWAADKGMTRFELRQAVKSEEEKVRGRSVDADGESIEAAELPWVPGVEDLTDAARSSLESRAPVGRLRSAFIAGTLWGWVWAGVEDAFLPGHWKG